MNRTILLVEDDPNDVFFMKRAMKLAGMLNPMHVVDDGRRAIHYLDGAGEYSDRARFPLPCLVLLDLKLPHVMGLDVLKWIREQPELRTVIVLVFTASKLPPDISKAYFLGANSYLVKPSEPDELIQMVTLIKHYWLELNHLAPALQYVEPPARTSHTALHNVSFGVRADEKEKAAATRSDVGSARDPPRTSPGGVTPHSRASPRLPTIQAVAVVTGQEQTGKISGEQYEQTNSGK